MPRSRLAGRHHLALAAPAAAGGEPEEASWQDIMPVDTLGLEVGYRLIPLVDKAQGGELLKRIKGIRKKFAQEVGFLAPPVHIRDNLELKPSAYRITLKGVEVGSGEALNGQFLAINPGMASGSPNAGSVVSSPGRVPLAMPGLIARNCPLSASPLPTSTPLRVMR